MTWREIQAYNDRRDGIVPLSLWGSLREMIRLLLHW